MPVLSRIFFWTVVDLGVGYVDADGFVLSCPASRLSWSSAPRSCGWARCGWRLVQRAVRRLFHLDLLCGPLARVRAPLASRRADFVWDSSWSRLTRARSSFCFLEAVWP